MNNEMFRVTLAHKNYSHDSRVKDLRDYAWYTPAEIEEIRVANKYYAKATPAEIARGNAEFKADKYEWTCTNAIAVEFGTFDNGKFTATKEF